MSEKNTISKFVEKYQQIVPNPLAQSLLIAAFTIPAMYKLKRPINKLLKRRFRDPRISKVLFGMDPIQTEKTIHEVQNSWLGKHGIPIFLGSVLPIAALAANTTFDHPNFGWTQWTPGLKKNSAYKELVKEASLWQNYGYQPQLDLTKSVDRRAAIDMINNNPYMATQDTYARHLGTSIIAAAPSVGNFTTLGNIYDSAQNKFQKKLSFQGVASKAVKGVVSGALAGMFTDVIGTAIGLPSNLSAGIANTVGIGKALHSILT